MRITDINTNFSTTFVYECDKGEGIPWHRHPYAHGTIVIHGKALVEIENETPLEMIPGTPNKELPPNLWHQITAIEPNTMFINTQALHRTITEVRDAD